MVPFLINYFKHVSCELDQYRERKQQIKGEDVEKGNGRIIGGRYHCFMVRSLDVIIGTNAAIRKHVRFTSERHLHYFVGGQT